MSKVYGAEVGYVLNGLKAFKRILWVMSVLVAGSLMYTSAEVSAQTAVDGGADDEIVIVPQDPKLVPCQHWDKIIFMIKHREVAERLNMPARSHLDIKVLDNPRKVADIKGKVVRFLNMTLPANVPPFVKRDDIQIIDVAYAIECPSPIQ